MILSVRATASFANDEQGNPVVVVHDSMFP